MELTEKAKNYAEENVIEVLKEAFAKVYADGYRDGYKDREEEIPVDLRDKKTEYVDLGLPSGTLWATDYEKSGEKVIYMPYCDASKLNLPTEEQWNELLSFCKCEFKYLTSLSRKYDFIGPNGNLITFFSHGYSKDGAIITEIEKIFFWLDNKNDNLEKNAIYMYYYNKEIKEICKQYMGYKLPVRLVRSK